MKNIAESKPALVAKRLKWLLLLFTQGILGLLFAVLSFRVIGRRRAARVSLGDGGDVVLTRRLRVHGNFAEYVPFGLVLMMLAELQSHSVILVHLIGGLLIGGRLLHAIGLGSEQGVMICRVIGMVLTLSALILGSLTNLGLGNVAGFLVG